MRLDRSSAQGSVHRLTLESAVLAGNFLGDPTARMIDVYVPYGHDGRALPLLVDLVGFTAGGPAHTNWRNFIENIPEQADRLIATGAMPPCVIAFPDCFTRLGGNQYINGAAMGRWPIFSFKRRFPSSNAHSAAAAMGNAAYSARAPAATARSFMRCSIPIFGPLRPVIPATWASSCFSFSTCRVACARSPRKAGSSPGWNRSSQTQGQG